MRTLFLVFLLSCFSHTYASVKSGTISVVYSTDVGSFPLVVSDTSANRVVDSTDAEVVSILANAFSNHILERTLLL